MRAGSAINNGATSAGVNPGSQRASVLSAEAALHLGQRVHRIRAAAAMMIAKPVHHDHCLRMGLLSLHETRNRTVSVIWHSTVLARQACPDRVRNPKRRWRRSGSDCSATPQAVFAGRAAGQWNAATASTPPPGGPEHRREPKCLGSALLTARPATDAGRAITEDGVTTPADRPQSRPGKWR